MGRQERLAGPTSRWPSSHTYSMREFTLKSVEMSVELGGCSGLPHVVGPAAKINFITDTVSFATTLASLQFFGVANSVSCLGSPEKCVTVL